MKKSSKKTQQKFYCEYCDYTTSRKSQWDRHKLTAKHLRFTNDDKNLKNIKRKVGENVKLEKSESVK